MNGACPSRFFARLRHLLIHHGTDQNLQRSGLEGMVYVCFSHLLIPGEVLLSSNCSQGLGAAAGRSVVHYAAPAMADKQ